MAKLVTLDSVRFAVIDHDTTWILECLLNIADAMLLPTLTITSGSDGQHSGPTDPHHCGHALDVRSHDLSAAQKIDFVNRLERKLGFTQYFCFLEAGGTANEHFHVQVRRQVTPPIPSMPPAGPASV